jgi:hypothetical protein
MPILDVSLRFATTIDIQSIPAKTSFKEIEVNWLPLYRQNAF